MVSERIEDVMKMSSQDGLSEEPRLTTSVPYQIAREPSASTGYSVYAQSMPSSTRITDDKCSRVV